MRYFIADTHFNHENIKDIFGIMDSYEKISKYYNGHIIYDAKKENIECHKRVLNIVNK